MAATRLLRPTLSGSLSAAPCCYPARVWVYASGVQACAQLAGALLACAPLACALLACALLACALLADAQLADALLACAVLACALLACAQSAAGCHHVCMRRVACAQLYTISQTLNHQPEPQSMGIAAPHLCECVRLGEHLHGALNRVAEVVEHRGARHKGGGTALRSAWHAVVEGVG
eukprot:189552-Chlamydomonas_euryale.AAC.1